MTSPGRPTSMAHEVVAAVVRAGETVVDATAGNGHDTLFLARLVEAEGKVVAFDVQAAALESTRRRLESAGVLDRVRLVHGSHVAIVREVTRAAVVMFNLGYLPGGDHSVITRTDETLRALGSALEVLRPGGVVTVVCYPGHPGGDSEAKGVVRFAEKEGGEVFPASRDGAPFLVVMRKF